jgi:hypothetical protein
MTTFTKKDLRFTFILASNAKFAGTNSNTLKVNGLRASATIKGSGLPAFPESDLTIFGLKQDDMNALTATQFQPLSMQRNTVLVEADSGQGFSTVFSGQIITSGPDYDGIPQAPLKVQARVLGFDSLNPATATSYTGATSVANIVGTIASKLGYVLENNGVNVNLSNPYFGGTLVDQLRAVASQAGIDVYTEGNVIAICPKGAPRQQQSFTLSPQSGLVGYPKLDFQRGYVYTKALYNSAFRFGGPITVQGSDVPLANGKWVIGTISHELSSLTPNGPWFSSMLLYPPNSLPPIS